MDMEDSDFGEEGLHGVDDIEHHEAVGGVVEGYKRTIEYLLSFHQNITYAPIYFNNTLSQF